MGGPNFVVESLGGREEGCGGGGGGALMWFDVVGRGGREGVVAGCVDGMEAKCCQCARKKSHDDGGCCCCCCVITATHSVVLPKDC